MRACNRQECGEIWKVNANLILLIGFIGKIGGLKTLIMK
jgi:hypothetical protein